MYWFEYPVTVPFGQGDPGYGGAHDADVGTPPNTPVVAILAGKIVSVTSPSWGKQVGIQLDKPYNGIPYMAFLHLAATNVSVGQHVTPGQIIGWSGGASAQAQYTGTSNPTGSNFLDDQSQSSQPQTGFALMRGPEYGVGVGWTTLPDPALNPMGLLYKARAALSTWNSVHPGLNPFSGIGQAWWDAYLYEGLQPPPTTGERTSNAWDGHTIIVQEFGSKRCEWDGSAHWYSY